MKFSDYKYERPDYLKVKKDFNKIIDDIKNIETYEEYIKYIKKINSIRNDIQTMSTLATLRYSINTLDRF